MKLQAQFTLTFIFLVLITIGVSSFLINLNLQSRFSQFIQEKKQEVTRPSNSSLKNFRTNQPVVVVSNRETPEQRFSKTVSNSLWWASVIDILLAIILAYFLSKILLQRIYRLKSAMHQYMRDGTSKPVFHGGVDEVDELANIYNLLIEKIEKEEKIRRDFFIDMSHELRTPLTSIKGYLEGLIDHVFDHEKEDRIHEKTLGETDRMIHLVKEMTNLAKLESGDVKISKETTDLKLLTDEVVEMFSSEIEKGKFTLEVLGEAEAEIDPYKFKQVMINLLSNALHYGKTASTIFIRMTQEKDRVCWSINNKADHIKPTELEHFFERFYRADRSRSYDAQKPHLGIGLSIVKKIVEQHNGHIAARMEGDTILFEVCLPSQ